MTVKVPGYSSLSGSPKAIVAMLGLVYQTPPIREDAAENLLKEMAEKGQIEIVQE